MNKGSVHLIEKDMEETLKCVQTLPSLRNIYPHNKIMF